MGEEKSVCCNNNIKHDKIGTVQRGVLIQLSTASPSLDNAAGASSDACIVNNFILQITSPKSV